MKNWLKATGILGGVLVGVVALIFGCTDHPDLTAAIVLPLIFWLVVFGIKKTLDELDAAEAREERPK